MRYNSPLVQVILVGLVCFCCPGMFNALNGLGGGGQLDRTTNNQANTALYATFVVFGILGGGIVNILGPRITMFVSGLTYALYSGSYVYFAHTDNGWLTVASGALLGVGAGILWAAQGMIMMSYPAAHQKGTMIGIFWVIFNLGGVVGSIGSVITNWDSTAGNVTDATYYVFVVLEVIGSCLAFALSPPSKVVRDDGTPVTLQKYSSVGKEALAIVSLFTNIWMIILIPMFFSSNFFYSYQFGVYNGELFNTRTKSFNSMLYWAAQMVGAICIGRLLDNAGMSRRKRAIIGITINAIAFNGVWLWTYFYQKEYTRETAKDLHRLDLIKDGGEATPKIILYILMGILDATWQSLCYWVMSTLSDDNKTLSRYAGFYKGIQSLGGCISWVLDLEKVSYMAQLIVNWVLIDASLPFMYFVGYRVKETALEGDSEAAGKEAEYGYDA